MTASTATLAAVGLAVNDLWELRTGRRQKIAINTRQATASLRSGTYLNYLKAQLEGTGYLPFGDFVLAGRLHMGSIVGANRGRIAPNRRFFAGGGGSVWNRATSSCSAVRTVLAVPPSARVWWTAAA